MRKVLLLVGLVCVMAVSGCAKPVQKEWVPTSGSRADATVKLSFEYNPGAEIPQVDEQQALAVALRRCNSWGYPDVEAFGGYTENCLQYVAGFGGPQCFRSVVTKEYQCIGRGDSDLPNEKK